jgi:hypothetical protein
MTVEAVAFAMSISVAVVICATFAHNFGLRWLDERAATRTSDATNAVLSARLDEIEKVNKLLAEDWLKKFRQLEGDWKKLKEHADSQFAGSIAQLTSQQRGGGFGR